MRLHICSGGRQRGRNHCHASSKWLLPPFSLLPPQNCEIPRWQQAVAPLRNHVYVNTDAAAQRVQWIHIIPPAITHVGVNTFFHCNHCQVSMVVAHDLTFVWYQGISNNMIIQTSRCISGVPQYNAHFSSTSASVCLKNFNCSSRTSILQLKMNAVACAQLI